MLRANPSIYLLARFGLIILPDSGLSLNLTLKGKILGVYIVKLGNRWKWHRFVHILEAYEELKPKKDFEIVFVAAVEDQGGIEDEMPWLALPFKDKNCKKLWRMFNFWGDNYSPGEDGVFVIIGSDGKSVDQYSAKVVLEYGVEAYPLTRARAAEYATEKLRAHTIKSILSSMNCQFLIKNNGVEIPVSRIFGKNILLFIDSSHCSESQKLLQQIIKWENDINTEDRAFEIIYLSSDTDKTSYNDLFRKMPWSAFPFGDELEYRLSVVVDALRFDTDGRVLTPVLIAFGPDGRVLTRQAFDLLDIHGVDATEYFTYDQLLKEVGDEISPRLSYLVTHKDGWEYYVDPSIDRPTYTSGHRPNYPTKFMRLFESLRIILFALVSRTIVYNYL